MIKPGSVCYLVNLPKHRTQWCGRVVTVRCAHLEEPGNWVVDAPWLVAVFPFATFCHVRASCLRPINDPDEPVTTRTPEELTA